MNYGSTTAIVLGYQPRREFDRYYELYTWRYGKVATVVLGGQKPVSKLSPALRQFATVDVHVVLGRTTRVMATRLVTDRQTLLATPIKTLCAGAIADFVIHAVHDGAPDPDLFSLLEHYYSLLGVVEQAEVMAITQKMYVDLLGVLGVSPLFTHPWLRLLRSRPVLHSVGAQSDDVVSAWVELRAVLLNQLNRPLRSFVPIDAFCRPEQTLAGLSG